VDARAASPAEHLVQQLVGEATLLDARGAAVSVATLARLLLADLFAPAGEVGELVDGQQDRGEVLVLHGSLEQVEMATLHRGVQSGEEGHGGVLLPLPSHGVHVGPAPQAFQAAVVGVDEAGRAAGGGPPQDRGGGHARSPSWRVTAARGVAPARR